MSCFVFFSPLSFWKFEFPPSSVFVLNKVVEEVYIEDSLDGTTAVDDPVVGVEVLGVSSPNPIEDVEEAVDAEKEHKLACDVLHLPKPL